MTRKYEFKTEPYDHQRQALRAAWKREFFAYFMEMGTGKSKVAVDEIGIYWENGLVDGAVIMAPTGVYMNWVLGEIPTHMPDRITERAHIQEWTGSDSSKRYQSSLRRLLDAGCTGPRVLVMNTETLSSSKNAVLFLRTFLQSGRMIWPLDESTLIKNPDSKRTKTICELGQLAQYRRIMTGSPVTRSPLDLYSQFDFLQPGSLGSRSYYSFRARYAVTKKVDFTTAEQRQENAQKGRNHSRKVTVVVGYKNIQDLESRWRRHAFRVTKDECLDLPPKVYTQRVVQMTPVQERLYTEMREFAVSELESGALSSVSIKLTMLLRLHQIVCGHVKDDDGEVHHVDNNRLDALLATLEETSGKAIIWSAYRHDTERMVEALVKQYSESSVAQFHGGNTKTRQDDVRRFKTDPECRFMISNQQSGGYGNTWTEATTVVYYSNSYDLEKRMQSEDRAHRSGQTRSVTYVDLVSSGTVDEKILSALRSKINISDQIMGEKFRDWVV